MELQCLLGGVSANDMQKALDLAFGLDSGMVHLNDCTVSDEPHVPFGGVKNSGYGREAFHVLSRRPLRKTPTLSCMMLVSVLLRRPSTLEHFQARSRRWLGGGDFLGERLALMTQDSSNMSVRANCDCLHRHNKGAACDSAHLIGTYRTMQSSDHVRSSGKERTFAPVSRGKYG